MSKRIWITILVFSMLGLGACAEKRIGPYSYSSRELARGKLTLHVTAASTLNSTTGHEAGQVLVKVYQLKDTNAFQHASFEDLWKRDVAVLGYSILRQTQFMVQPGSSVDMPIERNTAARYLGVVAIFKDPQGEQWRAVKELSGERVKIKLRGKHIIIG